MAALAWHQSRARQFQPNSKINFMALSPKTIVFFAVLATIAMGVVAQQPAHEQSEQIETISDIPVGSKLTFDHSIEIAGAIGSGAHIKVTKGGVKIHGEVQDNVTLETQKGSTVIVTRASSIALNSGSAIVITESQNSRSITINGQQIDTGTTENFGGFSGIEIQGSVSNHANLKTDASIIVAGNVGAASSLKANGRIKIGGNIGSGASLVTRGSINAENMGNYVKADAGGHIEAFNIGRKANLDAGGSIQVRNVSTGATLDAGGSVTTGTIASGAKVNAGGSINAKAADAKDISAGGSMRIGGGKIRHAVDFDLE